MMHFATFDHAWGKVAAASLLLLFLIAPAEDVQAQWIPKWLNVGDFQHRYASGGSETEMGEAGWHYPGIFPSSTYTRWKGFWISARNVLDEDGKTFPIRISHIGPRFIGVGEMFDISHVLVGKFPGPAVTVDGLQSFAEPVVVDVVDPSLAPDRMVSSVINSSVGVTVEKKAMQWSHPDHDGYHIIEYTFTNTGNVDNDEEIEVEGHTLDDVYFTFLDRPVSNINVGGWNNSTNSMVWGQFNMNDAVGDGLNDYGVDLRAQFAWIGNIPDAQGPGFNTIGNPMWADNQWNVINGDSLGRLGGANFAGSVAVHADTEAHEPGESSPDDRAQPSTMTFLNSDFGTITSGSDHNNESKMLIERTWVECGSDFATGGGVDNACTHPRTFPTHALLVHPDGDFANQTADPTRGGGAGGWGYATSYGPYTMGPGQQVKIVIAEGVAGLNQDAAHRIGRAYKLAGFDDALVIDYDANGDGVIGPDESMTKNEWVMTARDSLFQLFQFAIDNYTGGLNAPHPPPPPTSFTVTSGTDQIDLTWGGSAPAGWEVWRAQRHSSGIIAALSVGSDGVAIEDRSREYQLVAELAPNANSFQDTQVDRGASYYYYLQAVDGNGLKSSRYYAQTYDAAFLKRAPGTALAEIRIVPNPYHLGADPEVRFDVQDRIAFFGLPGEARIDIYSEKGELIRSLDHTDGSGDEFWDLTTSSRQLVVSGIYIAVFTNSATGEQTIQKLIVVR